MNKEQVLTKLNYLLKELDNKDRVVTASEDKQLGKKMGLEMAISKIKQLEEPTVTALQAWDKIAEYYPANARSLALSFEHFYYNEYAKRSKTNNIKITPIGNKYTIVIKEGNQDRWLTVDKDTARELIEKLGGVLNG